MKRSILLFVITILALTSRAQQNEPFWLGADISGTTQMESRGAKFYNKLGQERENTALMKELGMNAIRLRVWVNPRGGWSSKEDVLRMALRAKALDMALMIDFHYADSWADPGKQPIPAAWKDYTYKQMCKAVAQHTRETLQLLRQHGVDVKWVQLGNETTHGMLWDMGRAETHMEQYAGLTDAAYAAAKKVYPNTTCIVHLDAGFDIDRYRFIFDGLNRYKARYDMIGVSVYPYWDLQTGRVKSEEETLSKVFANLNTLYKEYGKELMIVETGYEAKRPNEGYAFMRKLADGVRNKTDGHCHGIFYWAPELEQFYPLGAFEKGRPTAILDAFTEVRLDLPVSDTTFYSSCPLDVRSENGLIRGRLYLPFVSPYAKGRRLPLVIMAHGFGATYQEPLEYAKCLAKESIATYVFDFCGGSMRSRSEGKTTDMNIYTEKADIEAITDAMRRMPNINPDRIMLLGCSQGGLVASITAAAHPDDYHALILIYPAFNIPDMARTMLEQRQDRPNEFEFWGMKLSPKYYDPLVDLNPYAVIGQYERPVMVVHGDKDDIAPLQADRVKQAYKNVRINIIKDGNHGFSHHFAHREAENYVLDFVRNCLIP